MKHEKTFEAIGKLRDVEAELHRLKNALEMANRALEAQRQWVGLTTDERCDIRASFRGRFLETSEFAEQVQLATEAKLKEKNK
jgi:hypothetical protein